VDFPGVAKKIFTVRVKSDKILFLPLETKKTAFFYGYTTFRSGPFGLAVSV